MHRPSPILGHHLLTRADLATLGVRATEVFRWLADGAIERIGDLPREGADPDPVFAVTTEVLRADLAARLEGIGKSPVVLTPLGVRSFLLRSLLLARNAIPAMAPLSQEATEEPTPSKEAAVQTVDGHVAEHLMETDLAEVLRDAVDEVSADAEAVLQLAAEIAATEAIAALHQLDDYGAGDIESSDADPEVGSDASGFDEHEMAGHDDALLEECFDLDELTRLDAATEEEESVADDTEGPEEFTEEFAEQGGETVEATTSDGDDTHGQSFEGLFDPAEIAEMTDAFQEVEADPEGAEASEAEVMQESPAQESSEVVAEEPTENATTSSLGEEPVVEAITEEAAPESTPADLSEEELEQFVAEAVEEAEAALEAEPEEVVADAEPEAEASEPTAEPIRDESLFAETELVGTFAANDSAPAAIETDHAPDPDGAKTQSGHSNEEFALTSQAMDKVQDFLGELRTALVEMAQRPQSQTMDVAPLVEAVQAGFDRSAQQATETSTALASLAERVGTFGERVEGTVQHTVEAMLQQRPEPKPIGGAVALAGPSSFVLPRPSRHTMVLGAAAILIVCWSILFWIKTGSPRLALGALIGANLVGCCLLVARRD